MARTTLCIAVPEYVGDALCTLAWREDRDPKRQAERLIREGLVRAGVLPLDVTDYREVSIDRPTADRSAALITSSPGPEAA